VSDTDIDELGEAARNRGLRLVRSRVRTPTKRRFGKVGLADKAGKAVFGLDSKGPVAKPEEVADYLRNLNANDWGASLDVKMPARKGKTPGKAGAAATSDKPRPPPRRPRPPKPAPKPQIRDARPADAERIAQLIRCLGHQIDGKSVRRNLTALKKSGETPLVATLDKTVVGLCGIGKRIAISRRAPLGRLTTLVVAEEAQGQGIGRMLVEAAEQWMRKAGCELIEVTSNDRRTQAHAFYRHMGYERTSLRFAKAL
jgi:N-acetylglutamate synthase-like GNAT family acetyltransferase